MASRLVEALFRDYYRRAQLEIPEIERREVGVLTLGGVMARHKAFRSVEELRSFCVKEPPLGLYYSAALYERPDEKDMDAKGWLGADLVFDIDGDHLDTPNCRGMELLNVKCLEDAKEEAVKLTEALRNELGLEGAPVYSGHRGFHVHVRSEEVRSLDSTERRRLVDFLVGRNLDPSKLEARIGKRVVKLYVEEPLGSLARIMRGLDDGSYSIKIDEVVTTDTHRLIRAPGSLNNKTGFIALPLSPSDLDRDVESILERAVAFKKGEVFLRLKEPIEEVLGVKIGREEAVLPLYIAIYLYLQGKAEIEDKRK
ncbi:MAG: DNA primase small subunit domain-containing protein [Thermoproteus sp.]